jgi:hypothetical protein
VDNIKINESNERDRRTGEEGEVIVLVPAICFMFISLFPTSLLNLNMDAEDSAEMLVPWHLGQNGHNLDAHCCENLKSQRLRKLKNMLTILFW